MFCCCVAFVLLVLHVTDEKWSTETTNAVRPRTVFSSIYEERNPSTPSSSIANS